MLIAELADIVQLNLNGGRDCTILVIAEEVCDSSPKVGYGLIETRTDISRKLRGP